MTHKTRLTRHFVVLFFSVLLFAVTDKILKISHVQHDYSGFLSGSKQDFQISSCLLC